MGWASVVIVVGITALRFMVQRGMHHEVAGILRDLAAGTRQAYSRINSKSTTEADRVVVQP